MIWHASSDRWIAVDRTQLRLELFDGDLVSTALAINDTRTLEDRALTASIQTLEGDGLLDLVVRVVCFPAMLKFREHCRGWSSYPTEGRTG